MNVSGVTVNATETITKYSWFLPRLVNGLKQAVEDQATKIREQTLNELIEGFNATTNSTTLTPKAIIKQEHNLVALSLNYFVSPYAGACMTMAIILNRTIVFASSRSSPRLRESNPLNKLGGSFKVLLRLIALGLLSNTLWNVILQYSYINKDLYFFLKRFYQYKRASDSVSSSLWEVFLSLCISQFIETLVSITSGQSPSNDSGLTLFEYSLAFQEAQFSGKPSPQVLTIVTFALVNQIINQISGIFHWKNYQLIPSTILGLGFLNYSIYSLITGSAKKFPIIVFFSIIPQIFVLIIIIFCLSIYYAAVLLNGSSEGLAYTPMIKDLKNSLNLQLNDDFNSVIMRFGFIMFTAVDNEEYVNELSDLNLLKKTYLESEGNNHLISGYFNDFGNNPELLLEKKKSTLDAKLRLHETNSKITNVYSFLRRYANLWRVFQSLYMLSRKSFCEIKATEPTKVANFTKIEGSTAVNQEFEIIEPDDESEDFQYESENDTDPLELDSDADTEDLELENEYFPTLPTARQKSTPLLSSFIPKSSTDLMKTRAIDELFKPNDLLQLISPQTLEEASYINALKTHLIKNTRLTRSKYAELNQDDLLKEVILSQRPARKLHPNAPANRFNDYNEHKESDRDIEELEEIPCVVCQTNRRSVILWPCKCLAICETCRLNLGVRGFKICVCCRRQVDGFSKIYIP